MELVFVAGAASRRWGLPPPAWLASLLICASGGGLGLLLLLTVPRASGPFHPPPYCALSEWLYCTVLLLAVALLLLKLFFRQAAVPVVSETSLWAGGQEAPSSPRSGFVDSGASGLPSPPPPHCAVPSCHYFAVFVLSAQRD